jgi:hypothetical protein
MQVQVAVGEAAASGPRAQLPDGNEATPRVKMDDALPSADRDGWAHEALPNGRPASNGIAGRLFAPVLQ